MKKDFLEVLKRHDDYSDILAIMNEQELNVQKEFLGTVQEYLSNYVYALSDNDDYSEAPKMESVIEKMLFLRLKASLEPLERFFEILEITPQSEIKISEKVKYRADFLIYGAIRKPGTDEYKDFSLVVECDGHEFHNANKEQVARDRKRDRDMILNGYVVLRFTGSEINKNARSCANDVAFHVRNKIRELI